MRLSILSAVLTLGVALLWGSTSKASDCGQAIIVQQFQTYAIQPVVQQVKVQRIVQQQVLQRQFVQQKIVQQRIVQPRPFVGRSFAFQRIVIR